MKLPFAALSSASAPERSENSRLLKNKLGLGFKTSQYDIYVIGKVAKFEEVPRLEEGTLDLRATQPNTTILR